MGKNNKKLTTDEFIERSSQIHKNKFDYSKSVYNVSMKKLIIICPIHGEFLQTPSNHYHYGCIKCGIEKNSNSCRSNKEVFIKKAKRIHGEKYNYDNIIYKNASTKIEIVCKLHGSFFQLPCGHLNGYGCAKCAPLERNQNKPKSTEKFIEDAKKIHKKFYNYSLVDYKGAHIKIEIICPKHGSFHQKPLGHLNGKGCSKCVYHISKPETEFLNYLKIPDIKENRQKFISPYKIDGYKNNKIFEFLGDYFHGNPNKYNSVNYNQICHKTFGELYENTIQKFNKLNDLGYSIYYIWESDWNLWNKGKINTFPIKKYNKNKI